MSFHFHELDLHILFHFFINSLIRLCSFFFRCPFSCAPFLDPFIIIMNRQLFIAIFFCKTHGRFRTFDLACYIAHGC